MLFSRDFLMRLWVLCAAFFLSGCTESQRPPSAPVGPATAPTIAVPRAAVAGPVVQIFDISALVGMTADQIRARLGKPVSDQQNDNPISNKDLLYRSQGYELFISYEVMSGRIFSFYIPAVKPKKEYRHLLKIGNVNQHDKRYLVEPLRRADGLYEGIVVRTQVGHEMD